MRMYTPADADAGVLEGKTIAIAGYGNQGRPQALNLRDSGCRVIVGARSGRAGWKSARTDGFEVVPVAEAARRADILMMLLPDEVQGDVFRSEISGALRAGAAICFAHGFAVAFGEIDDADHDVILVAPKAQGGRLREAFVSGGGVPCLVGVARDGTGRALALALGIALALGCLREGAYETTFREEAVSDLFGEQAVLCGGVPAIAKRAFDLLVRKGYSPEVAYFECVQELKIIVDLIAERGFAGMRDVTSGTAAYGSLAFGERVVGSETEAAMERLFDRIESGEFARLWLDEKRAGGAAFRRLRDEERNLTVEKAGAAIRGRSHGGAARSARAKERNDA